MTSEDVAGQILDLIDEETALTVRELSERTGHTIEEVKRALEILMERGKITSTPDWEYRQSRRSTGQQAK